VPAPIAPALRQTIALGVLGVRRSPSAPVIPVAAGPVPLCLRLVGSVVLVSLTLAPLPASTPLTLTSRLPAVALPGNLRTWPKCPPAARALPTLHGSRLRAQSTREAWAAPSADNNRPNAHHTMQGGYSVSGSIPLSNPGSIRVSAEAPCPEAHSTPRLAPRRNGTSSTWSRVHLTRRGSATATTDRSVVLRSETDTSAVRTNPCPASPQRRCRRLCWPSSRLTGLPRGLSTLCLASLLSGPFMALQATTGIKPVVKRLVDLDQHIRRGTALCVRGEAQGSPKCSILILADGSPDSPEEA